jgi:hypothetical protein
MSAARNVTRRKVKRLMVEELEKGLEGSGSDVMAVVSAGGTAEKQYKLSASQRTGRDSKVARQRRYR